MVLRGARNLRRADRSRARGPHRAREGLGRDDRRAAPGLRLRPRDGGLDGARDWGRVYWGGALYFLLADVRIRERTAGARGLEDALRAVVAKDGNVEAMWPLSRVLEIGDGATGTTVMRELYDELGRAHATVDLDALFRRLGVRVEHGVATFDDRAPLAAVRDAILPRRTAK